MASNTSLATAIGHVDAGGLTAIASFAQDLKARIARMLDLHPGQRVLDVGCGPGLDLPSLSAAVCPTGAVVGIDADAQMVRDAKARVDRAADTRALSPLVADARSLPFAGGVFDRCRCERLLQHVQEASAAVDELIRVVKVNGLVVAADTDWASLSIDCDDVDLERRIVRAVSDRLANGYAGRQLGRLMRSAGFEIVRFEVQPIFWTNFRQFRSTSFPATGVVDALLATGELSNNDWEQFVSACERSDRQSAFFASAAVVVVAGKRPC